MSEEQGYEAIDCNFHDVLEALCTRRDICTLNHSQGPNRVRSDRGRIVDLYTTRGAEFLQMDNGREIRLDRIVLLNDHPPEDYSGKEKS